MLFNSAIFIFCFLPVAVTGFYLWGGLKNTYAQIWLILCSLFFYGWWNPAYLILIVGMMVFNFWVGQFVAAKKSRGMLIFGIVTNLSLLAYYKYANFFVDSFNHLLGTGFVLEQIILPLAISFYTFQKIAYLVDSYKGEAKGYNFIEYCLFVTFFPQLIAGPIVHHKEIIPQLKAPEVYRADWERFAVGLSIFFLGLFKKTVLADHLALYSTPAFDVLSNGGSLTFAEAWTAAFAFTFQIYFDFSGYSDMAVGLARLFGIALPLNFFSPYKSKNITEFWRRWHMTLSRFLRDYLYIPLGGNRKGPIRRYINLFITMLLGGFWHGANWTFVLWGCMHGLYLVVNRVWQRIFPSSKTSPFKTLVCVGLTFTAVTVAWVMFRADSALGALAMYKSMIGLNGFYGFSGEIYAHPHAGLALIGFVALIAFILPNASQIIFKDKPGQLLPIDRPTLMSPVFSVIHMDWKSSPAWSVLLGIIAFLALAGLSKVSEFLYFQF